MHNRRCAVLHVKAKALMNTLSKSPSASKACEAATVEPLLGLRPAVIREESEHVIYPLCFTHTPFNDFAVIMNCLQGGEVPPLNHCLIDQAGHSWIRDKVITLIFQESKSFLFFFPSTFFAFQSFVIVYTPALSNEFRSPPPDSRPNQVKHN